VFDDWIPGVLSREQILELKARNRLQRLSEDPKAIDSSAVDLHLSDEGYELPEGSVKPWGQRSYVTDLESQRLLREHPKNGAVWVLERKRTYLFKLRERLNFPDPAFQVYGQATAKSSVGRVDVLARLIVDGMADYEIFTPEGAATGSGEMYVEITPITFDVCVKEGIALNQLRLFLGKPEDAEKRDPVLYRTALKNAATVTNTLSVDLSPVEIGGLQVSAFATSVDEQSASGPIPLWQGNERPKPWRYWRFRRADERNRLRIEKDEFYILRSKEHIALPRGVAVYCRASDETIGEMRIHYAGFAHPWFGRNRSDGGIGTPLIFEVRGHDVNVSLRDGERMARLTFYRMSEDAREAEKKDYDEQSLQLSKFFDDWPTELTWTDEASGHVAPRESR
jgi:dCTP deaminase